MRIVPKDKRDVKPGEKIGRWTVVGEPFYSRPTGRWAKQWVVCQCNCGVVGAVRTFDLKNFKSTSCGCAVRDAIRAANVARTREQCSGYKHGGTFEDGRTRIYRIWRGMRQRCSNSRTPSYRNYGGRGISVATEWESFEAFRDWSLKNGYSDKLSIDRINNDGNYEPDNCRWADQSVQQRNRRTNTFVEHDGKRMILKDYCDSGLSAVNYGRTCRRLWLGWTLEDALRKPADTRQVRCESP